MSLAQFCLGGLVLLPLLAAAVSAVLAHTARRVLGACTAVGVVGLVVPVVWVVTEGHIVSVALGGYAAPLGITLRADGLSVLFLSLTAVVGLAVTGYAAVLPKATGQRLVRARADSDAGAPDRPAADSPAAARWQAGHPGYWPLWLGCWAGLNAVFVSGDLFNTYVGLELVGLSAVGLVALGGRDSWSAALRYLFVAVLGSLMFLVAVGLIVAATGTLDLLQVARIIHDRPETHAAAVLALLLITVGLSLKVALVPMHRWLIPAHAAAPSTVSPLLSALVIKASLFVLLRCWMWLVNPAVLQTGEPLTASGSEAYAMLSSLSWVLAGLGSLALIVGSVMALRQTRLKPLIAYSTVAQAGYWFLFFPIVMDPGSSPLEDQRITTHSDEAVIASAVGGTLALALGHGIAKAALFLSAGFLKDLYGTDELDALRGSGKNHPTLMMAMGLAAVGLAGLPFSLAFTGKWELATSAVAAGHYWLVAVVIAGTLLSAAYLLKAISPLLVAAEDDETSVKVPERQLEAMPWTTQLAPFALGTLTIMTGFIGTWTAQVLEVGAPW